MFIFYFAVFMVGNVFIGRGSLCLEKTVYKHIYFSSFQVNTVILVLLIKQIVQLSKTDGVLDEAK